MAVGDYFTSAERLSIHQAIHQAELASRFEFSVFVGQTQSGAPRAFATQLHNKQVAPARSVMIVVDPEAHTIEIVTGGQVRSIVDDAEIAAVIDDMKASFAAGKLAAGLEGAIARISAVQQTTNA
ncbi:DUF5130 family protein [Nocardioides daejeonensis]|uniref:TPM domain-containing protein n=1 Tax=Nocardioides daejeonensis TaxID=1046556 RepID=UPI0013A5AA44|nr:TPM domain-containing protein [Nocardioides daejeonensis]